MSGFRILGIETSCDDTACAVVDGRGRVLASVVSSQLAAHRPYGGVVPEIASREHLRNWPAVSAAALEGAGLSSMTEVDAFAATRGPGLVGCLLVGLSLGRALAFARTVPFHAVHHLEGHLVSPFLADGPGAAGDVPERFVGLVVSGGHTSLLESVGGRIFSLAETRDDAMGEVFDKVGKRLGLAYPQGPEVDRLAESGSAAEARFAVATVGGSLDFSYSGLKSQALRAIEALDLPADPESSDGTGAPAEVRDLLAAFRHAAVEQLVDRVDRLHRSRRLELLAVSGGVAANLLLRRRLREWAAATGVELRLVPRRFSGDNAAMVAFAALLRQQRGLVDDPTRGEVASRLPFPKPA